jgi:glycosyltransferase involved in cell wall biosynthesis
MPTAGVPPGLAVRFPSLRRIKRSTVSGPVASVLVRVKNEAANLPRLLESLRQQTIFERLELVFLDSGSSDSTVEYLLGVDCSIYQIAGGEFSFGATCNLLMALSSAEICFFFSGHVIIEQSDALSRACEEIVSGRAAAGYFRQVPNEYCGATVYEIAFLRRNFPTSRGRGSTRPANVTRFSNAASVLSRRAWEVLWFPDVIANEDALWAQEYARRRPGAIVYFADLAVAHSHNEDPGAVERRVFINAVARREGIRGVLRATVRFMPMMAALLASGAPVADAFRFARAHFRGYAASIKASRLEPPG